MSDRYYKKYVEKMINTNPISIVVTRKKKVDDGYEGYKEIKIILQEQVVTIYNKKRQRHTIADKGITYYVQNVPKLLATSDVDIKEGDIFEHRGKTFRVAFLDDYLGICKQAELEVI